MRAPLIATLLATLTLSLATGCAGKLSPAEQASTDSEAATLDGLSLTELAKLAVSTDPIIAEKAIAKLRAAGQPGLDALLLACSQDIARLLAPAGPTEDPAAARARHAIEAIAKQRDAHAAGLYWYTDLAEARRVAEAQNKPILSLRLLGDLDEELSCANSRFFRTALYPDQKIHDLLRRSFVLHWKSERPAPKVTIDFGDGRVLERTVTGNSIHYVLDSKGRVVDALPGMYGPGAFLRGLTQALGAFQRTSTLGDDDRREALRTYHAQQRDALALEWAALLGIPFAPPPAPRTSDDPAPPANVAIPTAVPKGIVEQPIVAGIQADVVPLPTPAAAGAWEVLLDRIAPDARLDARSRAFMRTKIAADVDLEGHAMKPLDDATFERRLAGFQRAIAEDTLRNEYGMRRVLHDWLAMTPPPEEMEAFNTRVYASLFLTPRSDPWLGLLVKDGYSGIAREGIRLEGSSPVSARRPSPARPGLRTP